MYPSEALLFSFFFLSFFFVVASIKIVLSKRLLLHLNEEVSQLPYLVVFLFAFFFVFFTKVSSKLS